MKSTISIPTMKEVQRKKITNMLKDISALTIMSTSWIIIILIGKNSNVTGIQVFPVVVLW